MNIGKLNIKNNMVLAPLAGVSDYPFRFICRKYGCKLAYSEMVSAEGLVRGSERTSIYLYKGEDEGKNDNLLGIQIFGSNPKSMTEAAVIIQGMGADILDINMGCPVKKVVKTGAGSALLSDLSLLKEIVSSIRANISIPFTIKIRTGFGDNVNALEVAKLIEDLGVDCLAIHGRTQKQAYKGLADWDIIKNVKESLSIPVIGNGDVTNIDEFNQKINYSNCDGVMIGRGAMGKPWIFKRKEYTPSLKEVYDLIIEHSNLAIDFYGLKKGLLEMRKHISWYSKTLNNGATLRKMINNASVDKNEFMNLINNYFTHEL